MKINDGIYIENLEMNIPWSFSKNDLANFKADEIRDRFITWQNVRALQGMEFEKIILEYQTGFLGKYKVKSFTFHRGDKANFDSNEKQYQDSVSHITKLFGPSSTSGTNPNTYYNYPYSNWDLGQFKISCNIQERFVEWVNLMITRKE